MFEQPRYLICVFPAGTRRPPPPSRKNKRINLLAEKKAFAGEEQNLRRNWPNIDFFSGQNRAKWAKFYARRSSTVLQKTHYSAVSTHHEPIVELSGFAVHIDVFYSPQFISELEPRSRPSLLPPAEDGVVGVDDLHLPLDFLPLRKAGGLSGPENRKLFFPELFRGKLCFGTLGAHNAPPYAYSALVHIFPLSTPSWLHITNE